MKRTTPLVFVAIALASCAKQQEPAQAVETAPREAAQEKASAPAPAESRGQAAEATPGAQPAPPPAAAAGEESRSKTDLLAPDDAKKDKQPSSIDDAVSQLHATFSNLEKALALSAPDCVTAKQLRDRVCDLAEHICRLADEGAGLGAQERCGDGRGRCADAKRRYDQVCAAP